MHEEIRCVVGLGGAPASAVALAESLAIFMEIYMLLRCREFVEKSGWGADNKGQGAHSCKPRVLQPLPGKSAA